MDEIIKRDAVDYEVESHSLYEIINYNEPLVLRMMRDFYSADEDLCRCVICVEDVFALALNSIPPRYIQSTSLQAYRSSISFIDEDRIRQKVRDAVTKVHESPKH